MDCIFCKIVKGEIPSKKIYEDDNVIAILDLHPACDGHTLIIPKKHYEDFMTLPNDELNNIMEAAKKLTPKLVECFNAKAFSLRLNYLDSQEIKHYHLHLLPDYFCRKPKLTQEEAYETYQKYSSK